MIRSLLITLLVSGVAAGGALGQVTNPAGFQAGQTITASGINSTFGALASEAQPATSSLTAASAGASSDRFPVLQGSANLYETPAQVIASAGQLPCSALPALTGAVTSTAGACATTLGAFSSMQVTSALGFTPLNPANNLSELSSPATALVALGGLSLANGGTVAGQLNIGSATNGQATSGNGVQMVPSTGQVLLGRNGTGPMMSLTRTDASISSGAALGSATFNGADAGGNAATWASLTATATTSASSTSGDYGALALKADVAGVLTTIANVSSLGLVMTAGYGLTGATLKASSSLSLTNLIESATAPTISSGFGTSPTINAPGGTAAFALTVGTGGSSGTGTLAMPPATTGWNCTATDITTTSASVFITRQTSGSTTSISVSNYTDAAAAGAWAAGDVLRFQCAAF